ncbi:MAG: TRAP transporter fused permease subunit [Deltaproteobacteria bacterium]|nr:TRAP transporter fused permease subunit [Deltaproteobacteria bacterium]
MDKESIQSKKSSTVSARQRQLKGWSAQLVRWIAIGMSLFQLYTGYFQFTAMNQRVPHVTLGFILIFLVYPISKRSRKDRLSIESVSNASIILICGVYVMFNWFRKMGAMGLEPPLHELIMGGIFIILLIEGTRRALGWAFPSVAVLILLYARFGEIMPISATFIFLFILFGALLREAGGGEFFINFAYGICGRFRGGPAKIAIVASSLFGMLSGSGTANVAGTGQITIPLMKRSGYPPYFAGAVETVSSAGGLLMPPIMGSAVFIMMEILGVNYLVIIKASILMAVLYYLGLFLMVDIEAQKIGLVGLKQEEIPPLRKTLKEGWHFFIPLLVLIYFLGIERSSVTRAALWANISIPLIAMMRKKTRMSLSKILTGLEKGALTAAPVVAILSLGGIVVGMITLTGLGLMMSSILIELSHGSLFILLLMTMVASIILGMGVPPVAAYIILAILVVPALIRMGVYPLAAHLFVFYFGTIAGITPPMAPDAFVAAGIADSPMMKTALTACRLAIVIFILPYIFVYNNALLMIGNFWQIIWVSLTALLGVFALSAAVQNFMSKKLPFLPRIVLFGTSFSLIFPGLKTDLLGIVLLFSIILYQTPQLGKRFKGYFLRE